MFPASDAAVEAVGEELAKFRTSKGTFQFTEDNPITEPTIKKFIKFRLADISNA